MKTKISLLLLCFALSSCAIFRKKITTTLEQTDTTITETTTTTTISIDTTVQVPDVVVEFVADSVNFDVPNSIGITTEQGHVIRLITNPKQRTIKGQVITKVPDIKVNKNVSTIVTNKDTLISKNKNVVVEPEQPLFNWKMAVGLSLLIALLLFIPTLRK